MSYQSFLLWKSNIEDQLKKDDIKSALNSIFKFIESNQPYYDSKIPKESSISLMASLNRQNIAFNNNLIDWDKVNLERSKLIQRCLAVLEIIEEDLEDEFEEKNYPGIHGLPAVLRLSEAVVNIEKFLATNIKRQ